MRHLRFLILVFALGCGFAASNIYSAIAQDAVIPNFWDKHERFQKPELGGLNRLKFFTTTDFPPFNFIDRKKRLSGFHVDLARAICAELGLLQRCQIQALPWDELLPALKRGEGEALIAGLAVDQKNRGELVFTRRYLEIPGRFVVRNDSALQAPAYSAIFKKITGVVTNSSHQQYFAETFSTRKSQAFDTRDDAFKALKSGEISAVFTDALSASFWLQSEASEDCCGFLDGAFLSPKYFGQGMTIALPKDQEKLANAINFALYQINASGKFAELYLRYFPLGLY
ncbi:MAG: transporter substrate-binding domain-containing protein [Pseudomonadota bacterium]